MVTWLDQIMKEACDAAALRVGPKKPCRQAYWWQDSVAVLRGNCTHARRLWQKAKRRKRSQAIIRELGFTYKQKRKELKMEINRLKSEAWQDLLNTLDEDPWGLPYKLVLKKLRKASPSLTETLDPGILSDLLDSLFPKSNTPDPLGDWRDFAWSDEWLVQQGEVQKVIQKRTTPFRKAPGPDNIRSIIWKRVTNKTLDWIRHIFNLYLIEGEFPAV
ncbi:reverse transcriptase [Lasius niger]|uniref:Reverse transcriptase n=1 Tax=Lasius niger TaxID=67767 RepID=A0A0J7K532_LASNI|nr:reverse transcriptase [Lasius niger]